MFYPSGTCKLKAFILSVTHSAPLSLSFSFFLYLSLSISLLLSRSHSHTVAISVSIDTIKLFQHIIHSCCKCHILHLLTHLALLHICGRVACDKCSVVVALLRPTSPRFALAILPHLGQQTCNEFIDEKQVAV